jgi:hypothetical protein
VATPFILTDVRMYAGGCDLTGYSNTVELAPSAEEKDKTTFASGGWKEIAAGLKGGRIAGSGFWEAGDLSIVDNMSWAELGGGSTAWTIAPNTADVGDLAYIARAMEAEYKLGGQVGELAPWSATNTTNWPIGRGVMLHPSGTARTATGDGTGVEHVAVAAGQYVYATLHVLSIAGTDTPTITVVIESDVDALFNGSESTRITFDAATAISGQIKRTAGAITDTFWRATWTIAGTDPSFLFAVGLAVA